MIKYQQENNSMYMVIEKETMETDMDIDIKMLENNHIEPLLPVKIRHIDNRSLYYYDVTSRQQFSKIYEYRKLSRKNVDNILKSLNEMVDAVNEYMLNLNCIILKTDCIYVDVSKDKLYFAYGNEQEDSSFQQEIKRLFDYVIEHFDHGAGDTDVLYIYNLYQKIVRGEYDASDLKALAETESISRDSDISENKIENDENVLDFIPMEEVEEQEEVENKKVFLLFNIARVCLGVVMVAAIGRMLAPSYVPVPVSDTGALIIIISCAALIAVISKIPKSLFTRVETKKVMEPFRYDKKARYEGCDNGRNDDSYINSGYKDVNDYYKTNNDSYDKDRDDDNENYDGNTMLLSDYFNNKKNKTMKLLYKGNEGFPDIEVSQFPWIIGSMEKNCNTVLKSKLVSHIHACITRDNGEYYVEDLNSTNGTYINGERLIMNSRRELNNHDEITLAAVSYVVEMS